MASKKKDATPTPVDPEKMPSPLAGECSLEASALPQIKAHVEKPKTTSLNLMVKLTLDEQRAKGVELAEAISNMESLENEKAAVTQKIKSQQAMIEKLSGIVKNNQELRPVTCLMKADFVAMDMLTYRTDTEPHELVNKRPLTYDEKQLHLDLQASKEADAGEKKAEADQPKLNLTGGEGDSADVSSTPPTRRCWPPRPPETKSRL